jgi:hypothetical protein
MCDFGMAALAIGIASTAMSAAQQYQQQKYANAVSEHEAAYAQQNYQYQKDANWRDAVQQMQQIAAQSSQIDSASMDEQTQRRIEAMKARARAAAAAGEAGIGGSITAGAWEQDASAEAGRDIATMESNRRNKQSQAEYEHRQAWNRGQTVGLAPYVTTTGKPSLAGAVIGAGLSIGGQYAGYKAKQPEKVKKS